MSDAEHLIREVDEELRQEQLKALWDKYGILAIIAVVLVILGVGGYTAWETWQAKQAEARTAALESALNEWQAASSEDDKLRVLQGAASSLDHGGATLARFFEAAQEAKAGHVDQAVAIYEKLAADESQLAPLRSLALLEEVMVQADSGDPAALATKLAPLTAEGSAWRYSARELDAVLALRAGDTDRAKSTLSALADDDAAPQTLRQRVRETLAALGGSEAAK
ncbi:tetratricopeptide repeat protein [Radicibacter daui]|uniref:tetratricopeptide repeat protein n=1 Tax=Radicibacter daui TaxID=3064829 RepID=UPI004046DE13